MGIATALIRSSVSYVVWFLVMWLCTPEPVLGKMVAVTVASGAMAWLMEEGLKRTPTDECGMMANGIMMNPFAKMKMARRGNKRLDSAFLMNG